MLTFIKLAIIFTTRLMIAYQDFFSISYDVSLIERLLLMVPVLRISYSLLTMFTMFRTALNFLCFRLLATDITLLTSIKLGREGVVIKITSFAASMTANASFPRPGAESKKTKSIKPGKKSFLTCFF